MDLLNLDDLVRAQRGVVIKGVEYTIKEQTVGLMVEAIQLAKQARSGDSADEETFMAMVRTAQSIVDCPDEVLKGLEIAQLTALIEFAAASDREIVEGSKDETVEGQEDPKGE